MSITYTSDAAFDEDVVKSKGLTLVDFYADWCGPCKMLGNVLEQFVSEGVQGDVKLTKLNIDENAVIPKQFGVRGIPFVVLFKDGKSVATKTGAMSRAQLTAFIDSNR